LRIARERLTDADSSSTHFTHGIRHMSDFTDFRLPSGAVVYVQSSLQPPPPSGLAQASGAAEKAREAWSEGMALVREMAEGVIAQLKEATKQAEQVTVEFGVNISGKTGIILVEGEAAANLKVTVTWKGGG
jgi:hypothetical protein